MRLELYTIPISPFTQAVELQLKMKGVEYTPIVPSREFVREGPLREINPLRKIPVMLVDGTPIPEAQVIAELIEDLFPEPSLLPGDAVARAQARLLWRVADSYIAAPSVLLLNNAAAENKETVEAAANDLLDRGFAAIDHWLGDDLYAAGSARSIADCTLPTALWCRATLLPAMGVANLPPLPGKAAEYFARIRQDEIVGQSLDAMDKALEARMAAAG